MKILVIGGSKGIGLLTVNKALDAGHKVTAFSRNPGELPLDNPALTFVRGNVLNAEDVKKVVKGQDVVVCTLGLSTRKAIGPPFASKSYVLSTGTENIIKAMETTKVKRLVCVTAIGAGDSRHQLTPVAVFALHICLRWLFLEKARQEKIIKDSTTDWTIIRPTALTNSKRSNASVIKDPGFKSGTFTQASRSEVADLILNASADQKAVKQALILSNKPRFGDTVRWVLGYFGLN